VTYRASVSPAPSAGTVAFMTGGRAIPGCGAVKANRTTGQASCTTTYARAAIYLVQAVYSGSSGSAGSQSKAVREVVRSSLTLRSARSRPGGTVQAALRCAAGSGGCAATVELSQVGNRRVRTVILARKTARIPAGATRSITIALSSGGRRLLAKLHTFPAALTVMLGAGRARSTVATAGLNLKSR
jgi:hypothetical protein